MSLRHIGLLSLVILTAGCATTGAEVGALQRRVQQLEDQEQIRTVLVEYGEYLDARNYAGYASLFARDGVWTGGFGSATGPADIQAMLEKNLGKAEPGLRQQVQLSPDDHDGGAGGR